MELTVEIIINSDEYVLINFKATNCDPCQMIEPTLQQVKNAIGKRIAIYVLDVNQVPQIVSKYNIKSVPMLVLFHKGEIIWQLKKFYQKKKLLNIL